MFLCNYNWASSPRLWFRSLVRNNQKLSLCWILWTERNVKRELSIWVYLCNPEFYEKCQDQIVNLDQLKPGNFRECSLPLTFWIPGFSQSLKKQWRNIPEVWLMCLEQLTITLKFTYFTDIWGPEFGWCSMLRKLTMCNTHATPSLSTQLRRGLRSQKRLSPRWWHCKEEPWRWRKYRLTLV